MSYPHYSTECNEYHNLVRDFGAPRPKIVCLCGSTRFSQAFQDANYQLTLKGCIVLSIGCVTHSDSELQITADQKIVLDALHLRKIELADEIFVLNVGGYIGESTRNEINYALKIGRPVLYLEKERE